MQYSKYVKINLLQYLSSNKLLFVNPTARVHLEAIRKVLGRKSTLKPNAQARNVRQTAKESAFLACAVGLQCPK